jgi:hypothetical protein
MFGSFVLWILLFPIHVTLLASAYFGNDENVGLYYPDDEKIMVEEKST